MVTRLFRKIIGTPGSYAVCFDYKALGLVQIETTRYRWQANKKAVEWRAYVESVALNVRVAVVPVDW